MHLVLMCFGTRIIRSPSPWSYRHRSSWVFGSAMASRLSYLPQWREQWSILRPYHHYRIRSSAMCQVPVSFTKKKSQNQLIFRNMFCESDLGYGLTLVTFSSIRKTALNMGFLSQVKVPDETTSPGVWTPFKTQNALCSFFVFISTMEYVTKWNRNFKHSCSLLRLIRWMCKLWVLFTFRQPRVALNFDIHYDCRLDRDLARSFIAAGYCHVQHIFLRSYKKLYQLMRCKWFRPAITR